MDRRSILRIGLAVAAVGCGGRQTLSAQPAAKSSGPPNGSLLIIGGGMRGPDIQEAAMSLGRGSGGPGRWVYIPTAAADNELARATPPAFIARSGATMTVLHTRDRAVADTETFIAPLRAATAVFIDGGRQCGHAHRTRASCRPRSRRPDLRHLGRRNDSGLLPRARRARRQRHSDVTGS